MLKKSPDIFKIVTCELFFQLCNLFHNFYEENVIVMKKRTSKLFTQLSGLIITCTLFF